ncbi:MAG TPA: acetylxylan esterase [Candidatus Angelobacter sp.]|nr:acetylxylan esterase [Candidatus Angelobacter sp.]
MLQNRIPATLCRCSVLLILVIVSAAQAQNVPEELGKMFNYNSSAPLDLKQRVFDRLPSATIYDIDFASPIEGRVTGFLVIPSSAGPHPGVVFAHWGQGDRFEFLPEALVYARAGIVSIMIDYPWVRPQPWREPLFTSQTSDEQDKKTEIQAVVDLRRSFDVLRAQPSVDVSRIGYVGHSFGAQFGAILTAVDKRMAAAVLITGTPSYRAIFLEGKSPDVIAIQQQAGLQSLGKAEEVMRPLDAIRYVPFAAPVRLLFQFAQYEPSFSKQAMQSYFEAASQPKSIRWYPAGHELNDIHAFIDRSNWIADQLMVPALRKVISEQFKAQKRR